MELNLNKLTEADELKKRKLNCISNDIKKLENFLAQSAMNAKCFEIEKDFYIRWCSKEKRLICVADGISKPLIEHDRFVRRRAHIYLQKFVDEMEETERKNV